MNEQKVKEYFTQNDEWISKLGKEKLQKSFQVLENAILKYSTKGLAISWNGGKDATVIYHLLRLVISFFDNSNNLFSDITAINFISPDTISELQIFAEEQTTLYDNSLVKLNAKTMKEDLQSFLNENKEIKAIVMGTRSTDPSGKNLDHYSRSDVEKGWPDFIRVNPILFWDYSDVWLFLLSNYISYCPLYDQGYTSIGHKSNSAPNPSLQNEDGSYRPAYSLRDSAQERCTRQL